MARHMMAGVIACAIPAIATAQTAAPQSSPEDPESEIVVVGNYQSQRGAVQSSIPPEKQLSPADIRALGVNSVTELLAELAPLTRSDQGRGGEGAVTLLDGRRISGFAEIRDLPAEAIERVDILPEEVALKYGYSANQKVVNIVLRRRFRAMTGDLDMGGNEQTTGHLRRRPVSESVSAMSRPACCASARGRVSTSTSRRKAATRSPRPTAT